MDNKEKAIHMLVEELQKVINWTLTEKCVLRPRELHSIAEKIAFAECSLIDWVAFGRELHIYMQLASNEKQLPGISVAYAFARKNSEFFGIENAACLPSIPPDELVRSYYGH